MTAKSVKTMDRAWLNDMARRPLITPIDFLKSRPVIAGFKHPRAKNSRREREIAEACLFFFGLSCQMQRHVWVIDHEDADYDFVAVWKNNNDEYFTPIQLKEVVPTRLNPNDSIQSRIDGLAKYVSVDLAVAIRINRQI